MTSETIQETRMRRQREILQEQTAPDGEVIPFDELRDGEWYVLTSAGLSSVVRAHHRPGPWGRGFTTIRGNWHGLDSLDPEVSKFRPAPTEHV